MKFDLIGDIHGCYKSLISLLKKLGYTQKNGIYQQTDHQVIFLGDFIDRGPYQREVINIVRPMINNGFAQSVMGNHEYNAIAYATPNKEGKDYLRKHNIKNDKQHQAFLDAFCFKSAEYYETIEWFKTLPLWLDLEKFRVIHACWDSNYIKQLETQTSNQLLNDALLHQSTDTNSWQFTAIETLLKGKEILLPKGQHFYDKDGNQRHNIRIRWWDQSAKTYNEAFLGPESAKTNIPDDKIDCDHLIEYAYNEKPIFLGHYWLEDAIQPLAPNVACLDYSVAKPNNSARLVAYRFTGEQQLNKNNFVWVTRQES